MSPFLKAFLAISVLLLCLSCKSKLEISKLSATNNFNASTRTRLNYPSSESYLLKTNDSESFLDISQPRQFPSLSFQSQNGFGISFGIKLLPFTGDQFILFADDNDQMRLELSYESLVVRYREQNSGLKELCKFQFTGAGTASFAKLLDGKVHQIALLYSSKKESIEIWIDGSFMLSNKAPLDLFNCTGSACEISLILFKPSPNKNLEMELHTISIYHSEKAFGESFRDKNPQGVNTSKEVAALLLAPKNVSVLDQIKVFPLPRYASNHDFIPNFNWADPSYYGSEQLGIEKEKAIDISTSVQKELAENWNYYIVLPNIRQASSDNFENTKSYLSEAIRLANSNPHLPLSVITLWAQIDHRKTQYGNRGAIINRRNLKNSEYLQNSSGEFFDDQGKSGKKSLSPLANLEYAIEDGKLQAVYVKNLLPYLMRPIQFINENGEVAPHLYHNKHLEKDPRVVKALEARGLPMDEWRAERKTAFRKSYLNEVQMLPELNASKFSWYNNAQGSIYFYQWDIARKAMSKIKGSYYATPSFYPKHPSNWKYWRGPWHGWQWIDDCRQNELVAGDKFFSPFVAAGWSVKERDNIRPGQWLGLLKCLGVAGSEFFYTGFFNVGESVKADPKKYIWQLVMPSYAQATLSNCNNLFRNARFLQDDNSFIVSYPCSRPDALLVVRKLKTENKYLIAANINSISNVTGNIPNETDLSFIIDKKQYTIKVKPQGSVLALDLTGPGLKVVEYDNWHENKHPWFWSKKIMIEAETLTQNWSLIGTQFPSTNKNDDLREFKTYLILQAKDSVLAQLPMAEKRSYYLSLKLRGKGKMKLRYGSEIINIEIEEEQFKDYTIDFLSLSSELYNSLNFEVLHGTIEIDFISLIPKQ